MKPFYSSWQTGHTCTCSIVVLLMEQTLPR